MEDMKIGFLAIFLTNGALLEARNPMESYDFHLKIGASQAQWWEVIWQPGDCNPEFW